MSAEPFFEPREFRVAPEYRCCLYYVMVAGVFLAGVAWWVESTVRLHNGAHVTSVALVLLSVAMIFPLSWRLELNGEGLVRHRCALIALAGRTSATVGFKKDTDSCSSMPSGPGGEEN